MPLYRCLVKPGLLTEDQRAAFARHVTDVHCEVTGAPSEFVNVHYIEDGDVPAARVFGMIRAGRTDDQKSEIKQRLASAFASVAGVRADEVSVTTADVPASWVMEGGRIMPEPGEEDAWLNEGQKAATS